MMPSFEILFMVLASVRATASANFNYDSLDENSSWVAELGGQMDFQLAVVGRRSGRLFVAARDRLLQLDSELNLLRSVSLMPRCRRDKQHRQQLTVMSECSQHNNATLLTLLPTTHDADTGRILPSSNSLTDSRKLNMCSCNVKRPRIVTRGLQF